MSGMRVALLIGCANYQDPKFHQLPAPAKDVDALGRKHSALPLTWADGLLVGVLVRRFVVLACR
jgi:hypothetical protein